MTEIEECAGQIVRIREDCDKLVAGLSETQFNWQPAASGWSIGQCLEHLNRVGEFYEPHLERCITQAHSRGLRSDGPFHYGWFGRYFVRMSEPPPKSRFPAPARFVPQSHVPMESTVRGF
ncbi:MAG: DinB family protein, partial [Bryobacteraceae bacterium]